MKYLLFPIIFNAISLAGLSAQCPVTFTYDAAGNRDYRNTPCAVQEEGVSDRVGETAQESTKSRTLAIAPNPSASGIFYLTWQGNWPADATVAVVDFSGRVVRTPDTPKNELDLSDMSDGLYLILVQSSEGASHFSVEKVHP
jgi:hypothetical protein